MSAQAFEQSAHQKAPLIELRDVSVAYGSVVVLENINLTIAKGEFVSVLGASGCGKTTLLRLIAGLSKPSSGEVIYNGKPFNSAQRDVSIVFQDYSKALLPWRTVPGNVALAFEAAGIGNRESAPAVDELLERLGLAAHKDKYPGQLSGGMQQRLQIARCLAQSPSVLLMDEPFGALDALTRQSLQDEILRIVAASGATAFFVTHDIEEAIYLGDRVVCMRPHPGQIGEIVTVTLPGVRDQISTRETPEFLRLRRFLFNFIKGTE